AQEKRFQRGQIELEGALPDHVARVPEEQIGAALAPREAGRAVIFAAQVVAREHERRDVAFAVLEGDLAGRALHRSAREFPLGHGGFGPARGGSAPLYAGAASARQRARKPWFQSPAVELQRIPRNFGSRASVLPERWEAPELTE